MTTSRRAANRKAWADRIERFKLANQSVAEFCASEGIAPASFYQWRRKLVPGAAVANAVPRFVPVQLPSESTFEAQEPQISTMMSVELPGGIFTRFDLASIQFAGCRGMGSVCVDLRAAGVPAARRTGRIIPRLTKLAEAADDPV